MNNKQRGFVDFGPALEFLFGLVILGFLGALLFAGLWLFSDDAGDVAELCETEGQFVHNDTTYACRPAKRLVEQWEEISP